MAATLTLAVAGDGAGAAVTQRVEQKDLGSAEGGQLGVLGKHRPLVFAPVAGAVLQTHHGVRGES